MSAHGEIAKDILLKAIDSGYIPRASAPSLGEEEAQEKNLKRITLAYKEIFKAVNNPLD